MKKMLLLIGMLMFSGMAKADSIFVQPVSPDPFSVLGGQLQGALITHVQAIDQVTTDSNKLALLDSVLLIGKLKEDYLAHVRFGYSATKNSDGSFEGSGFQAGLFIPINNIVKSYFTIPEQYGLVNGLQYGPGFSYDFQAHHSFLSLDVGWSYGPK